MAPVFKIAGTGKHNMGQGFIATRFIPQGTRIMSEGVYVKSPLSVPQNRTLAWENRLKNGLETTPDDARNAYLELRNRYIFHQDGSSGQYIQTPYSGRFRSNAIPLNLCADYPLSGQVAVFLELSHLNHSCCPNAQLTFNEDILQSTLHATRDIVENEEITISYIPGSYIDRQKLIQIYNIDCYCEYCLQPERDRNTQNELRQRIDYYLQEYKLRKDVDGIAALKVGRMLLDLLVRENNNDWKLARLWEYGFDIVAKMGDKERAKIFAALAARAFYHCEGEDSKSGRELQERVEKFWGVVDDNIGRYDMLSFVINAEVSGPEPPRNKAQKGVENMDWLFMKRQWAQQ